MVPAMTQEKPLAGSVLSEADAAGPDRSDRYSSDTGRSRSYDSGRGESGRGGSGRGGSEPGDLPGSNTYANADNMKPARRPAHDRKLDAKIAASKTALLFEAAAPRLWTLAGVVGFFVLASLMGVWSMLAPLAHKILLGAFIVAFLAALVWLARLRWPSRIDALRRIERISQVKHRPASSYEDTLSNTETNPETKALWRAHRQRLATKIDKLRVGKPAPRTDRHDPLALRAALLLGVIVATAIAGDSAADRLRSAFYFNDVQLSSQARLDAWVTPPAYTVKPPIMLSDGSRPTPLSSDDAANQIELPQNSELVVRLSGTDLAGFALEVVSDSATVPGQEGTVTGQEGAGTNPQSSNAAGQTGAAKAMRIDAKSMREAAAAKARAAALKAAKDAGHSGADAAPQPGTISGDQDEFADTSLPEDAGELRYIIKSSATIRVFSGHSQIAHYRFTVIPDHLPKIALLKLPVRSRRGELKLQYKLSDDYGVTSAQVRFELLPPLPRNPATAWARKPAPFGKAAKPPQPPVLTLTMPRDTRKGGKAKSLHDLAKHAWSGRRVRMTLIAKDHAGQTGSSKSIDMLVPERWFRNRLARAIAEQRRHLIWDARKRHDVLSALKALSADPEGFIKSKGAYLGLRSAYHRLRQPPTPKTLKSVADQLWDVAVRIEDGNLTAAQRRLRDAQDKLSKLLEKNASPEEIAKAMKELRQALADYMKQLAQQAPNQRNNPNGTGKNQYITNQDFEKMLRDLEKMARSGNRNAAQQMLSEMRDLLDRLQSGRQANNRSSKQQQQMMKMMDEFGDLINKQQKLLDDTFQRQQQQQGNRGGRNGEERSQNQSRPGQQGQQGQQGRNGEPGRKNGSRGRGQAGRDGQGEGEGQGRGRKPGQRGGNGQLADRQGQLRDQLNRLGDQLQQFGLKRPGEFGKAGKSMGRSKRALGGGRLDEGMRRERQALNQLRKGAQSMAEQMLSRMARRYGQRGQQRRSLDPLGRPRGGSSTGNGTEFSSRVQIPDKFRTQRSREILEELRRRLGESKRPKIELDYIERLLKQF